MNSPNTRLKNESFLTKLDTFRKKKNSKKEAEDLAKEGRKAMASALCSIEIEDPEHYMLEEGQERSIIERASMESEDVKNLINVLITWINDELVDHRILVRNIADDFYDGQILQNLAEKLAGVKLEHPEVTQSEFGQMHRLKEVIMTINQLLGVSDAWASQRWSPEMIYKKDVIATLRLLVALAKHYKSGIRIADDISLKIIIVRKINGILNCRYQREYVTAHSSSIEDNQHPLDFLPNHNLVVKLLQNFVNDKLKRLQLSVLDLPNDLSDGVLLILLMGLLEGYFVPLYCYHPSPTTDAMRIANVNLLFELMRSAEIAEPLENPEEIVLGNSKAIMRLVYSIYSHYAYDSGDGDPLFDVQEAIKTDVEGQNNDKMQI